jgi:hypothetical protein
LAHSGTSALSFHSHALSFPRFLTPRRAAQGIWSTLFLEYWKRKEKLAAMKWGMVGFEDTQQDRYALWATFGVDFFSAGEMSGCNCK